MIKHVKRTLSLLVILAMASTVAFGQLYEYKQMDGQATYKSAEEQAPYAVKAPRDQGKVKGGTTPPATSTTPFDGGLTLVLAAGAGLALKNRFGKKNPAIPAEK